MSRVEENKAVILRGFEEEWNKGNLDVIPEIFTTDLVCHMVHFPDIHGQDEWRSFVISFRSAFPDIHFTIEDHFGEKDKVATRWTCSGTHKGEFMGIPPTGVQVSVKGVNIYHFRDGKISEFWATLDNLGLLQQLGVIPPLGQ